MTSKLFSNRDADGVLLKSAVIVNIIILTQTWLSGIMSPWLLLLSILEAGMF